jgi:hypothetical protein
MNKYLVVGLIGLSLIACKSKKKKQFNENDFFPVAIYLKGQAAAMDSSFATIMAIQKQEGGQPDTTYIKREEFKHYAKEFLELPDISSPKLRNDYTVTNMYDDLLGGYVFTYTTDEKDNPIKKEDVILEPGEDGQNKIKTVNVDWWSSKGDSTIQKNMLWEANKRFLIITKVTTGNQPEKIRTLEVKWNDFTNS